MIAYESEKMYSFSLCRLEINGDSGHNYCVKETEYLFLGHHTHIYDVSQQLGKAGVMFLVWIALVLPQNMVRKQQWGRCKHKVEMC